MNNSRSKRFKEALREWDRYKDNLNQLLKSRKITQSEYDRRLKEKAKELDL